MAVNESTNGTSLLYRPFSRGAGALALAAAIAGVAVMAVSLISYAQAAQPWHLGAIGLCALAAAGGVNLLLGRPWAQQLVLVLALATAVAALAGLIALAAYGMPQWWQDWNEVHVWLLLGLPLAASGAVACLALMAAERHGRLRYASYVELSTAAAAALLLLVNMIAHKDSYRRSIETLGQYRLSDRTKLILGDLKEPIRITAVYRTGETEDATGQTKKLPDEFRQRLVELLEDMHQHNAAVEVRDASRDVEKAAVLERLRKQASAGAQAHLELLKNFRQSGPQLIEMVGGQRQQWASLPPYLSHWAAAASIAVKLGQDVEQLEQFHSQLKRELSASGVPDYGALTRKLSDTLGETADDLSDIQSWLKDVAAVAAEAKKNSQAAIEALAAARAAAVELSRHAGTGEDDAPATAASVDRLSKALEAAKTLADRVLDFAQALSDLAGPKNRDLVGQFMPLYLAVPVDATRSVRMPLASYLSLTASRLADQTTGMEQARRMMKPEIAAQMLDGLGDMAHQWSLKLQEIEQAAKQGIEKLTELDDASAAILTAAAEGKLFAEPLEALAPLRDKAKALPELKDSNLSAALARDNLVIIEAAGKVEVVDFDQVWPMRRQVTEPAAEVSELQRRAFNGDAAIASRILAMTRKPFARVLLTYVQPDQRTMQMMMMGGGDYAMLPLPANLSTLKKRLEDANFQVAEWDLAETMPRFDAEGKAIKEEHPEEDEELPPLADTAKPKPAAAPAETPGDSLPTVLLILPSPAMSMTAMGMLDDDKLAKISQAVDDGAGAVFLAQYSGANIEPALCEYLRKGWGIELQSNYRLVAGIPDQTEPGRYEIDVMKFIYTPIAGFSDHPIAKPLQSQRTLWSDACPVQPARDKPAGVDVAELLCVDRGENLWASRDIREIVVRIESGGGFVRPDFGRNSMPPPLCVAMAAQRRAKAGASDSRIVVLGVGGSMFDRLLANKMPVLRPSGGIAYEEPPVADADMVTNSVYWIIGRQDMIAAGPATVKPVRPIPNKSALWALCVLGLPVAIIAVGGVVMFMRRR